MFTNNQENGAIITCLATDPSRGGLGAAFGLMAIFLALGARKTWRRREV